ncbi:MAG: putative immunity protein [Emergencia timonensis]|uniref:putative immunity protein n=1 Tax=Emergencia timonensis TaxID=1776384 RepID=UPI00082A0DB0|nr:hypothetical protein [Emergencia timonensis]WNX87646.1 hypothetical protein RVY71_15690 [Emergencia timonensis]
MAKGKLRKMLGSVESKASIDLMNLIETQSKITLGIWAVTYAKDHYLAIYEEVCPAERRLREIVTACEEYLQESRKLSEVKPLIREAGLIGREITDNPVGQAAARAISAACAVMQTPTNALGFLFYGAAAVAYSRAGLTQPAEIYDELAEKELGQALNSLQKIAVCNESNPVKIKWNC